MEESVRPTPINKEVVWDKSKILMSKTDPYGVIEYANDAFIEVSGYEEHELVGKPHNIVRHPDMPRVIFKVLWDYLKKGKNIHAIVKNMSSSGRFYWVITDFDVKTNEKGIITNYYGRRRAAPMEIVQRHIEPLYEKLLQIETATGIAASEKYLVGYLEDIGKSYNEFIEDIITDGQPRTDKQPIEKKGFFTKFFGR
ncbi:PAS domain S-box-containing protein [Filimonas lacunae]|uniref:PAS domain S-box-containing protein n=2 Tax=Filimonas lacunae TaxID=477680 RepID=A0A173MHT4_9BACT|nr:methyl-accepting chemotaxis protein [Filimonas lacunae]SIS96909.1 PAS domain S-box-containing protein [Filimonas lacunae]